MVYFPCSVKRVGKVSYNVSDCIFFQQLFQLILQHGYTHHDQHKAKTYAMAHCLICVILFTLQFSDAIHF